MQGRGSDLISTQIVIHKNILYENVFKTVAGYHPVDRQRTRIQAAGCRRDRRTLGHAQKQTRNELRVHVQERKSSIFSKLA